MSLAEGSLNAARQISIVKYLDEQGGFSIFERKLVKNILRSSNIVYKVCTRDVRIASLQIVYCKTFMKET